MRIKGEVRGEQGKKKPRKSIQSFFYPTQQVIEPLLPQEVRYGEKRPEAKLSKAGRRKRLVSATRAFLCKNIDLHSALFKKLKISVK